MDDNFCPKIADFGLSRVVQVQTSLSTVSAQGGRGSFRWMAPELMYPDAFEGEWSKGKSTPQSDVYAFAMTCLEVSLDSVTCSAPTS